jgi:hypothetical protein
VNLMHLTITSNSSEEAFRPLAIFANSLERVINPLIANESYGPIERLILVVVAVEDDEEENLALCAPHNKSGSYKHPITGERVKYLSIAVPVCPKEIVEAFESDLRKLLIERIIVAIEAPTVKIPKGFDYNDLVRRLITPLQVFERSGAN